MRDSDPIEQLRRKLLRHGLPAAYVNRTVRELSEHRQDLMAEAEENGLNGDVAERSVAERMGNLDELAARLSRTMRRSNWRGRHPVLTFCWLPIFTFLCGFLLVIWIGGSIGELAGWWKPKSSLGADGSAMVTTGVHVLRWGLFTAIPFWFCWLARTSYCGYKWGLTTCLTFSLHGLVHSMSFTLPLDGRKASLVWGYSTNLDWLGMAVPLLVFALFLVISRQTNASETRQEEIKA
jgi:hypothetical protein